MMPFSAASFNPLQLLGGSSQPGTPLKVSESGPSMPSQEEALRYLAAAASSAASSGTVFPHLLGAPPPGMPFPILLQGMHHEQKPDMLAAASGGGGPLPGFVFDPFAFHPYAAGLDGARRKNATRETTAPLKGWLSEHRKNPYPTKAEKVMLALVTKMTLTQVSTWFANARRRLKKENKMTWSPRNRPADEDDDDDLDGIGRPGSSASDISLSRRGLGNSGESNNNEKRPESSPRTASETPKKNKIWSIADTVKTERVEESSSREAASGSGNAGEATPSASAAMAAWQQQFMLSRPALPLLPQQLLMQHLFFNSLMQRPATVTPSSAPSHEAAWAALTSAREGSGEAATSSASLSPSARSTPSPSEDKPIREDVKNESPV